LKFSIAEGVFLTGWEVPACSRRCDCRSSALYSSKIWPCTIIIKNIAYSVIIKTIYCYTVGGIIDSHCGYKCVSGLMWAVIIVAENVVEVCADVSGSCNYTDASSSDMGPDLVCSGG